MCYGYVCDYGEHFQQSCVWVRVVLLCHDACMKAVLSMFVATFVCLKPHTCPRDKKNKATAVCLFSLFSGIRTRVKRGVANVHGLVAVNAPSSTSSTVGRVGCSTAKTKQQGTRTPPSPTSPPRRPPPPPPINKHTGPGIAIITGPRQTDGRTDGGGKKKKLLTHKSVQPSSAQQQTITKPRNAAAVSAPPNPHLQLLMPVHALRPLQTLIMPVSVGRPKRKSRGDAEANGGDPALPLKENSAPATKKKKREDGAEKPLTKVGAVH